MYEWTCPKCGEIIHASFIRVGAVMTCPSCQSQQAIVDENVRRILRRWTNPEPQGTSSGSGDSSDSIEPDILAEGEGGSPEAGDVPGLSGLSHLMQTQARGPNKPNQHSQGAGASSPSPSTPTPGPSDTTQGGHGPTTTAEHAKSTQRQNNPASARAAGNAPQSQSHSRTIIPTGTGQGTQSENLSKRFTTAKHDDFEDYQQSEAEAAPETDDDVAPSPTPDAVQQGIGRRLGRARERRRKVRTALVLSSGLVLVAAVVGLTLYTVIGVQPKSAGSSSNTANESQNASNPSQAGLAEGGGDTHFTNQTTSNDPHGLTNKGSGQPAASPGNTPNENRLPKGLKPEAGVKAICLSKPQWKKLDPPRSVPPATQSPIRVSDSRILTDRDGSHRFKSMLVSGTVSMVDRATLTIWLVDDHNRAWAMAKQPLSLISGLDTKSITTSIPKKLDDRDVRAKVRLDVERTLADPDQITEVAVEAFGKGKNTVVRIKADAPGNQYYQRMTFHVIAQFGSRSTARWRIDYPVVGKSQHPVIFAVAIPDAPENKDKVWSVHGIAVR